jgi:cyanophycinase-like exopeptidase
MCEGHKWSAQKGAKMNRKILLTSAGFETETIRNAFFQMVEKPPADIKALFIPTAAISPDAVEMVWPCMMDLLTSNIAKEHITIFDLHCNISFDELKTFDAIYFTGGSPQYLLQRINETGFHAPLRQFVDNGGIYIGVSAGAIVGAGNLSDNLGYLNATLSVHCTEGMDDGAFDNTLVTHIDLKNDKAIRIIGDEYCVI